MRKQGGTASRRDKHVTLAAISPPGIARGRFVGGQQSGLAGCKPPPLFTRGASSCSSQARRQGEPWGASPQPSAPTYLPTLTPSPVRWMSSAPSDSEGYHTCYPSNNAGAEPVFLAGRSHTAPNPELACDAEREASPRRTATTILPRHTGDGEEVRMDGDATGDTVMSRRRAWSSGEAATGS